MMTRLWSLVAEFRYVLRTNAEADGELLDRIAAPDATGRELLLGATERMHLTARGYTPRAARRAHHRRPRRRAADQARPHRRGAVVPQHRAPAALTEARARPSAGTDSHGRMDPEKGSVNPDLLRLR
jgi:hypothetical protein